MVHGLSVSYTHLDVYKRQELMSVSRSAGNHEAQQHEELFDRFFDRLPKEFVFERELLRSRLWRSPERLSLIHI